MAVLWKGLTVSIWFTLTLGLLFSSGLFTALLYGKITGKDWAVSKSSSSVVYAEAQASAPKSTVAVESDDAVPGNPEEKKESVILDAPLIKQYPELHSGCEVTSLAMLLNYSGIKISKMDLVPQMKRDETPIRWGKNGSIAFWGNPNTGFVGDITGAARGFGIYHVPLFDLLHEYIPSAVDLTGSSFDELERRLSAGVPVVAWTTIGYTAPERWVSWDSPAGPVRTTFNEHAVLLVGYDKDTVYVNDPLSGMAKTPVDKEQFLQTWEAMGKQALSYIDQEASK
jgi:uncharacterized protein YvpB